MNKVTRPGAWLDWLVALILSALGAYVVFWQNARLAVLWDLSYILENSYRISLGQVPYRDFPFPYAPLTFLIQAALIKFTGRVFFHHVVYCALIGALSTLLTWRILLTIMRGRIPHYRLLALVLTTPLAFLGVYSIFPHPFYDSDCTFAILACILLLLWWHRQPSFTRGFVTGVAVIIPVFIKQNTGLAFLLSTLAACVLLLITDLWRHRPSRTYFSLFAGVVVAAGLALFLIHETAGLANYGHWTIKFAAARRTPAFKDMLDVYSDSSLKYWLGLFCLGAIGLWVFRGKGIPVVLSVCAMAAPFVWPMVYLFLDHDSSERAERLVGLWPLVLIVVFVTFLLSLWHRKGIELVLPLIIIGTVHGAFLSQQLWGSTYALWPFFMILIAAFITTAYSTEITQAKAGRLSSLFFAFAVSVSLLLAGFFYVRSHERLDYANLDDGEVTHSRLAELKGLSMRGSWIPDFEELISYAAKEIPPQDGILFLPGEDLFYYTTGRRPQFPVVMMDHTINPYSPQEIVSLARERNIQWLIVKDELQLEEEPVEQKEELMRLLLEEFDSQESLDNYEIYKRKSDDAEDDSKSDDEP